MMMIGRRELEGELFLRLLIGQVRVQERKLDFLLGQGENNALGAMSLAHLWQRG
jgi:hypothetical protein